MEGGQEVERIASTAVSVEAVLQPGVEVDRDTVTRGYEIHAHPFGPQYVSSNLRTTRMSTL